MTKKEIRKLAQEKIQEGKTQQQAFDEIKELAEAPDEEVANLVKTIPTLQIRKKYQVLNAVLISLLLLTVVFKVILAVSMIMHNGLAWSPVIFIFPVLNCAMLYGAATYAIRAHQTVAILTGLGFIQTLGRLTFQPVVLVDLAITAALIGLGIYLQGKLTPGFTRVNETYTNPQGKVKARVKIRFADFTGLSLQQ